MHADPDWSDRPLVDFTAHYGESYRVAFSRPTPRFLELVLPSDGVSHGDVGVTVPWHTRRPTSTTAGASGPRR